MAEGWDLPTLALWRGRDVVAEDGTRLGSLEAIVYDYRTGAPVWVGIGGGPLNPHMLLAPAASAVSRDRVLEIGFSEEHLREEPPVEIGEGWSYGEDARNLHEYFGMDYEHLAEDDIRVLHRHSELPGQERVIGGGAGSP